MSVRFPPRKSVNKRNPMWRLQKDQSNRKPILKVLFFFFVFFFASHSCGYSFFRLQNAKFFSFLLKHTHTHTKKER